MAFVAVIVAAGGLVYYKLYYETDTGKDVPVEIIRTNDHPYRELHEVLDSRSDTHQRVARFEPSAANQEPKTTVIGRGGTRYIARTTPEITARSIL